LKGTLKNRKRPSCRSGSPREAGDVVSEEERDASKGLPVGPGDRAAHRAGRDRRPGISAEHRDEKENESNGVEQGSKSSVDHDEIS
jgi:hypothetical protein